MTAITTRAGVSRVRRRGESVEAVLNAADHAIEQRAVSQGRREMSIPGIRPTTTLRRLLETTAVVGAAPRRLRVSRRSRKEIYEE